MKIGILTYHRAENYGALLQAYAMKTYLQSLGHDVSFVDYWPQYHSDYFKLFPWQQFRKRSFLRKVIFLFQLIIWAKTRIIRKKRFQKFMYEMLELQKNPQYTNDNDKTENYDIVVYGSDQIWRKQNLGGVGFDPWYFGEENIQANKKVVYAGSMGTIDVTTKDNEYVQKMMKNFSTISVREKDFQTYLEGLGVSSSLVTDPVFLLTKEQWRRIETKSNINEKYILFYNLLNTPDSKQFAEHLSQIKNIPIREVNKRMSLCYRGKRYISTASVEKFLQLVDGAEYVVSNSFHGVAMSIIFQKQFYAVGMHQKSNRVKSLLQSLGICERFVEKNTMRIQDQNIDYHIVNTALGTLINRSKLYIQHSI